MRLADVSSRMSEAAQRHQIPERLDAVTERIGELSGKAAEQMSVAGEAARRGAQAAYRLARENPKTSIAGIVLAAAVAGAVLWYLFGDPQRPVERRRKGARVRAVSERRRQHAQAG